MGNSTVLKETALVEAFNLKAAIEYTMKNTEAAVCSAMQATLPSDFGLQNGEPCGIAPL